jgi:hypothetical protein
MLCIPPVYRLVPLFVMVVAACGSDKGSAPQVTIPTLDSIVPSQGTVGTVVTAYGATFEAGEVRVYFNDIVSPAVERQADRLFATAPEGLVAGSLYGVRVVNPSGGADTLLGSFRAVPPTVTRVNGVTKPTGVIGMTVLIEGNAFGDAKHGKVWFEGAGGTRIQAVIADSAGDWANEFIVTSVPAGTPNASAITVETATGSSTSIAFSLITGATFSPSVINWTRTADLPQPLQGLGAVFVPSANATANPSNYVFVVGGAADQTNVATTSVFRAAAQPDGSVTPWVSLTPLSEGRAYHAVAAATAYTAPIDTTLSAGYLYAIGGIDPTGATRSTVLFARVALDGSVDAWQESTPLPVAIHSASAVVFRGFIYISGGADAVGTPTNAAYRAAVAPDGSLGPWLAMSGLPDAVAFHAMLNFGPYLYAIGGNSGVVALDHAGTTGGEVSSAYLARVNLRTGDLLTGGWFALSTLNKARAKHSTVVGGAYLFTTSGVYSGNPGSSENTYSQLNADGTITSWQGATGTNTIGTRLGYDLYNQAAISFVDASGNGHVLVLGGAKRQEPGRASAAVLYY